MTSGTTSARSRRAPITNGLRGLERIAKGEAIRVF